MDLKDLNDKIGSVKAGLDLINNDYKYKKTRHFDSKMKLEELRHYKERVKN